MLRRDLKILSFIFLPVTQVLIPAISMIVSLVTLFCWFLGVSLCGKPLKPWEKIKPILEKVQARFTKDIKRYADNYGHASGVPMNWDGKVYGLGVDPLVIAIAIFLYISGVILMTPTIFLIFMLKSIPILIKYLISGWNSWLTFYLESIKNYASIDVVANYQKILAEYAKSIKELNPSILYDCAKEYNDECNPTQCLPKKIGLGIVCLLVPIIIAYSTFIIGFVLVMVCATLLFILALVAWILFWPFVIVGPPVGYIGGKF